MSQNLSQKLARRIIERVGSTGQPPEEGLQYFSVGLEKYIDVINQEYFENFIKDGGTNFKMVVGSYGGGKTHFLYSLRYEAWKRNYVTAYVTLQSSGECPFHAIDLVYKAIVRNLMPPLPESKRESVSEQGICALLKAWYVERLSRYLDQGKSVDKAREDLASDISKLPQSTNTSISFSNAIRYAIEALHHENEERFNDICQWLLGEGFDRRRHSQYKITGKIDRTTAMNTLRALSKSIRDLDYTGLVILLDEAEQIPSLTARNRDQHLDNLRGLIDECAKSTLPGVMIFYAIPDEKPLLSYEALSQRISAIFETTYPIGVKLLLDKLVEDPSEFLYQLGNRLVDIYAIAYNKSFDPAERDRVVRRVADEAVKQRYGDEGYKRLFVQRLIQEISRIS